MSIFFIKGRKAGEGLRSRSAYALGLKQYTSIPLLSDRSFGQVEVQVRWGGNLGSFLQQAELHSHPARRGYENGGRAGAVAINS